MHMRHESSSASAHHDGYNSDAAAGVGEEAAYKRKRVALRAQVDEAASTGRYSGLSGEALRSPGGSIRAVIPDSDESGSDSDSETAALLQRQGWPTRLQVQRRLRRAWLELRLLTVFKVIGGALLLYVLLRSLLHHVADRGRSSHYSVVALLRDMRPEHLATPSDGVMSAERAHFALQWAALQSWSAQLRGENILLFVDSDHSCDFIESHIRNVQCFVLPAACSPLPYAPTLVRWDCLLPTVRAHAPAGSAIVFLPGNLGSTTPGEHAPVLGPQLGQALGVLRDKGTRFVLTARRGAELSLNDDILAHFQEGDFVNKVLKTASSMEAAKTPSSSSSSAGSAQSGSVDTSAESESPLALLVFQRAYFDSHPDLFPASPPSSSHPPLPALLAGGAVPYADWWMFSRALLDQTVTTIDASGSVGIVHVSRAVAGAGAGGKGGGTAVLTTKTTTTTTKPLSARVGASYNEGVVRALSGNSWRVGNAPENSATILVGNCALGAAVMKDASESGVSSSSATATGASVVDFSSASPSSLPLGCFLAPNPNVTDRLLWTKRVHPHTQSNWLVVLPVHAETYHLALQWLCWAERHHFTHFVVHALDQVSARKLRARGGSSSSSSPLPVLVHPRAPESVQSPSPSRGGLAPPAARHARFVQRVLRAGFGVVMAQVDSVWVRAGEEVIEAIDAGVQDVQVSQEYFGTDAEGGSAATTVGAGGVGGGGGGLVAIRATHMGRFFWTKVVECQRLLPTFAITIASGAAPSLPDYMASECVGAQVQELRSQAGEEHAPGMLDPLHFPSAEQYFGRLDPVWRGVLPLVVRNDDPADVLARRLGDPLAASQDKQSLQLRRLSEWGLDSVDRQSEECIVGGGAGAGSLPLPTRPRLPPSSSSSSSSSSRELQLIVRVLAFKDAPALKRLLDSLARAATEYSSSNAGDSSSSKKGSSSLSLSLRVEVSVDHPTPSPREDDVVGWSDTLALAREFPWPGTGSSSPSSSSSSSAAAAGKFVVVEQAHHQGDMGQWVQGWVPAEADGDGADRALCVFIEAGMEVSPRFFLAIHSIVEGVYAGSGTAVAAGNFDPRTFGVGLALQEHIEGESIHHRFGSRTTGDVLERMRAAKRGTGEARGPLEDGGGGSSDGFFTMLYKYQLPSRGATLFFPQQWRSFRSWLLSSHRVDTTTATSSLRSTPCVPTLRSNELWRGGTAAAAGSGSGSAAGRRAVAAKPRDTGKMLAAWMSRFMYERGWYTLYTHSSEGHAWAWKQSDAPPAPLALPLPAASAFRDVPVFDFHFRLVPTPDTLVYRPALANINQFVADSRASPLRDLANPDTQHAGGVLSLTEGAEGEVSECWIIDQLAPQLRREEDERRTRAEAIVRAKQEAEAAAAEAEAAAAEAARIADKTAKRKARLAAAAKAKAKLAADTAAPTGGGGGGNDPAAPATKGDGSKDKAAGSKPKAADGSKDAAGKSKDASKGKSKGKEAGSAKGKDKSAGTGAASSLGPLAKARLAELKGLGKTPAADVAASFDASVPSTARVHRFLSSSLSPLWAGWPKSRWLSVDDGRFGSLAHFVAGHVDAEATVSASAADDAPLKIAGMVSEKMQSVTGGVAALQPGALALPTGTGTDFALCVESFPHSDDPMRQVSDMWRVSKKGVVLIEPHDTPLDAATAAASFPPALQKALAPLAGQTGVGEGVRADATQLVDFAKSNHAFVYFKVFAEEADVAQATKEAAAGQRPSAMLATILLKKQPTPNQLSKITKAGFIAATTE